MALRGGENSFRIEVTSQDSTTTNTYYLVVTRAGQAPPAMSPNAALYSMSVSSGSFSANFNFGNQTLTPVTVPNSVSSVNLFLYSENAGATAKVNGTTIPGSSQEYYLTGVGLAVGSNTLTVVVTAEDGAATRTYPLEITRLPYVNVDLSALTVNSGTITPTFAPSVTSYNLTVPYSAAQLTVRPVAALSNSTISVTGAEDVTETNPTAIVNLNSDRTTVIRMTVRAADGQTTKRYTLNVARRAPDARLSGIVPSQGNLASTFNADSDSLTVTVANAITAIRFTPTAVDPQSAITVNGTGVTSGNASAEIALLPGDNTATVLVTAPDGTTTKTYHISIKRALANIAWLKTIRLDPGSPMVEISGTSDHNYQASVGAGTGSVTLAPTAEDPKATITVNGVSVASGTASQAIPLPTATTLISVVGTAQDGTTRRSYSITIRKTGSNVAWLKTLRLGTNTAMVSTTGTSDHNYEASVAPALTSVTVVPTAEEPNATITVNGTAVQSGAASAAVPLTAQATLIRIVSTAQDGTTKRSYSITVRKTGSAVAWLKSIKLGTNSPFVAVAGTSDHNFETSVASSLSSVNVIAVAEEPNATIKVDGVTVTSGVPSQAIPIPTSTTVINVVSTAQDGTTKRTYSITVKKTGSNIAWLRTLRISPNSTLTATTGLADHNYRTSVGSGLNSVTVVPTAEEPNATIRVNGTTVQSGQQSQSIALLGATTLISIESTAQDGTTKRTYSVTINRAAQSEDMAVTNRAANLDFTEPVAGKVTVSQAISPNGDGQNDVLRIDGISAFPKNSLQIMNRAGVIVYRAKNYDNISSPFDGKGLNGEIQRPGTYFYQLEYLDGVQTRRKTGYIIIKY